MVQKFQRTKFRAYVKLGLKRKKLQRYKRPTGRHNKLRQKWKSRPCMVEIGYKNKGSGRNLINGKIPVWVYNQEDLAKAGKENIAIIGKVGRKNKIEIAKKAAGKNIEIFNLNIKKFLKKTEKKEAKK